MIKKKRKKPEKTLKSQITSLVSFKGSRWGEFSDTEKYHQR